ncbi:hypothetical protein ERO13_D09G175250v2 [Gossypium hirsutum]|uniref:Uncharacterized protein n=2 Tax=Gossypium TaxID=3633 RepID=A0A5D2JK11_GOSTO|nr:hypothetical protein ERO13_D09G175250v2 [Gossypium hirsutum]TYG54721.1 hypothetical protein ES288_D09G213200v1 [Gossypium darwinii]TYH55010.1 hypothetical protein ES332_D09G209100v1 [Gossypium tomentosum]
MSIQQVNPKCLKLTMMSSFRVPRRHRLVLLMVAVTLSCSALGAHLNWDLKCDIFSVAYLWGGARFYYHQSFLLCFLFLSSVWNKGG